MFLLINSCKIPNDVEICKMLIKTDLQDNMVKKYCALFTKTLLNFYINMGFIAS